MTLLSRISGIIFLCALNAIASAEVKLNGVAVHTQLSQEQFVAAVFAETPTNSARSLLLAEEDKAMEVRVVTDTLYARRFKRMWIEGIAINAGGAEMQKHAQHLAEFSNMLRINLKAGDVIRIERKHGRGTNIAVNGVALGTVDSDEFFDLLLRTWVGPVPLSSQFKERLLANGNIADDLHQRFNAVRPTQQRVNAIADALRNIQQRASKPEQEQQAAQTQPSEDQVAEAAPQQPRQQPSETAAPRPEPKPKQPRPTPAPEIAEPKAPTEPEVEEPLFADEDIFSDEEEDITVTAEGLLAEQLYISKLTKWTGGFVSYPRSALRNNLQGTVRIMVSIKRNGKLHDVRVLEKSEHDALNRAAVSAVKAANPFPAVPDDIDGDTFVFTVPVVFRLQ